MSTALTDPGQRLLDNAGPAVDQALESLKTVKVKRGEVTVGSGSACPRHVEDRLVNTVAEGPDTVSA